MDAHHRQLYNGPATDQLHPMHCRKVMACFLFFIDMFVLGAIVFGSDIIPVSDRVDIQQSLLIDSQIVMNRIYYHLHCIVFLKC